MSTPFAARLPDDTIPSESKARVCPQCERRWPASEAPETCPTDGTHLVRPEQLPTPQDEGEDEATIRSEGLPAGLEHPLAGGALEQPLHGLAGSTDDPMVGRTLEGRYTILARLGAGSMGTVYRARQHAMGREVAIKILRGDRAGDETAKARFMREARATSLLASPNTVTVFDFGQSTSGEFYLAMELLEGESLGQRLTRVGRLPTAIAVDAARQALRSLGEAHAKGIIHRDLKPDNLLFARVVTGNTRRDAPSHGGSPLPPPPANPHEEIVKVLDFGIAKLLNPEEGHPMGVVETQAGTVFGTPRYMSPEQAQGKPLDPRSDLYSLGVMLYQMLAGRPPFTDDDAIVVMARHIKSAPKPLRDACPEAAISRELEDVVMRTLAKDPADRPETAEILAGELLAALEAHGAMTSGVRASLTNAAGIRVPESIRPPAIALPSRTAKVPWRLLAIFAMGAVVLAVALGVFLGMSGRGERSDEAAKTAVKATSTDTTTKANAVSTQQSAPVAKAAEPAIAEADAGVAVTTPDALPLAASPAPRAPQTGKATAGGGTQPARGRDATREGKREPARSKGQRSPTAPESSAHSGYGIFD